MGGFCHYLFSLVVVKLATAVKICSLSPWNFLILQKIEDLSGSYLPLPFPAENTLTLAVLDGTGILITTLLA